MSTEPVLATFLADVRRRARRAAFLEGCTAVAWSVLVVCASSLLVAQWAHSRAWIWAIGAVGVVGAVVAASWPAWRRAQGLGRSSTKVARYVEQRVPGLYNGLVTSVELGDDPSALRAEGISAELVKGVRESTVRRLRGVHPAMLVDHRLAVAHGKVLAAVSASALLIGAFWPGAYETGWLKLTTPPPEPIAVPPPAVEIVDVAARDIRLKYVPPAYTRSAEREVAGSAGDFAGLAGSAVHVVAKAIVPVAEAYLEVGQGEEPALVPLQVDASTQQIAGVYTLEASGTYRFRLVTPEGQIIRERSEHSIDVQPDEPPDVVLLLPEADLEVHAEDVVRMAYRARDDFGLDRVELVIGKTGPAAEPIRKRLDAPRGGVQAQGEMELAIGELDAEPGDILEVWFEAFDENTVSGPSVGRSETRTIKVWSPKEKHEEIVDQLAAIAEAMLDLLADRLEGPVDTRDLAQYESIMAAAGSANAGTLRIVEAFGAVLMGVAEDPLMPEGVASELVAMRARHDELQRSEQSTLERISLAIVLPDRRGEQLALVASHHDENVGALERDIAALEDIIERLRQDMLKDQAKDLLSKQDDLMKLLEQLAATADPNDANKALEQIDALQQQLQQMMMDLAKQAKQMPTEKNINAGALDPEGTQQEVFDFHKELEKIKEMIAKGDIEGAKKAAQELQKRMAEMMAMMDENMEGFGGMGMSPEARQKLQELDQKVGDLAKEEQKIYEETNELNEAVQEALREQMRQQMQAFLDKQKDRAQQLQQKLDEAKKDSLNQSEKERLDQMREQAKDIKDMLERTKLDQAQREAEKTAGECENLGGQVGKSSKKSDDAKRASDLQDASDKLGEAGDLAQKIADDIENAMPKPGDVMNEQQRQRMKQLQQQQAQNRQNLEQLQQEMGNPGGDMPMMPQMFQQSLEEARQSMNEAEGDMQGQRPGEAQGHAQEALERLGQARRRLQQMMQPQKRTGPGAGLSTEDTAIPQPKDYQVPEEFRSEIMKAMQENAPKPFKPMIDRYYQELIQ